MLAWYLVTTKLKSEIRVKNNLFANHGLETFFPVYPPKKAGSAIGLPLFPRYVFVKFELERDFQKIQYAPGVTRIVSFGSTYLAIDEEVILCLRDRCDEQGRILPPHLYTGQQVRVKDGLFEGCKGIVREKKGNRRVQLLLELAYGPAVKVELRSCDVEPYRQEGHSS